MSTDAEWEKWGARDPYFSVLTDPQFRSAAITDSAREFFFDLGRSHVEHVLRVCRAYLQAEFQPQRVLDFGCGVGRVLIPFARTCAEAVGVDVAPSMLAEARRNCDAAGVDNVVLLPSDDALSAVGGQFDLVHSCIVIQHIEIARGVEIFQQLLRRIRPGGIGALQVTFAWDHHAANLGVPPPPPPPVIDPWWRIARRHLARIVRGSDTSAPPLPPPDADPEMQMNFYNLSQLMFALQQAGAGMVHVEMTDHGGAIGAFMYFRLPERTAPQIAEQTT